jgi:septal ring factor EnvC (AmiA/AmiB activator)
MKILKIPILIFYLNSQIEAADKQLKATRQFLEDQATEREQERDEFSKEIEKLRVIVKEKDKNITSQDSYQKEVNKLNSANVC